ncbi:PHP domain-containing protein [bacterium]|nr:PHP domain-containing protein [bacterium]
MINYKELIQNFTKEDYKNNLLNLHLHTTYSDGEADFQDLIKQAKEKNFKYIAISDHNTIQGHRDFKDKKLIPAVEFDVWYKYIFLHLLAYGIDPNAECMEKFYAKSKKETEKDIVRFFSHRNIKELIKAIHEAGGIAVLAHPACCWALNMEKFVCDLVKIGLDGIEVYYPYPRWRKYLRFAPIEKINKIAEKFNLIKTGGSDLHSKYL